MRRTAGKVDAVHGLGSKDQRATFVVSKHDGQPNSSSNNMD